jgi:NAD(P)H-nitrite reductase large subunit
VGTAQGEAGGFRLSEELLRGRHQGRGRHRADSGYEIYIAGNGGNGGIKTEVAQFLCKVSSDQEVMEVSGAFLQIYREEARYLDRTVHWVERVERVGLD